MEVTRQLHETSSRPEHSTRFEWVAPRGWRIAGCAYWSGSLIRVRWVDNRGFQTRESTTI